MIPYSRGLRKVILGSHLERRPAALHAPFVAAVLERVDGPLMIHHVRPNIDAVV